MKIKKLRNVFGVLFLGSIIFGLFASIFLAKISHLWVLPTAITMVISFFPFMIFQSKCDRIKNDEYQLDLVKTYQNKTDSQLIVELLSVKSNQEYYILTGEIVCRFIDKVKKENGM